MFRVSHHWDLQLRRARAESRETLDSLSRHQARLAINIAISSVFGIDAECLWRGTRGVRDIAEARQVAMYLAHVCCRMSLTEVGAMFGRDRTTVAHACLKVEYRRDDPDFDRALDILSWALPTMVLRKPSYERRYLPTDIEDHECL